MKTLLLPDGREKLLEDYDFWGYTIPKGFISDGASSPRIVWSIIPPYKDVKRESFLHDYLCVQAKSPAERKAADALWLKTLFHNPKINDARAIIGYIGVRIGAVFGVGVHYPHWTDIFKKFMRKVT